jgi:hypothetical protein
MTKPKPVDTAQPLSPTGDQDFVFRFPLASPADPAPHPDTMLEEFFRAQIVDLLRVVALVDREGRKVLPAAFCFLNEPQTMHALFVATSGKGRHPGEHGRSGGPARMQEPAGQDCTEGERSRCAEQEVP